MRLITDCKVDLIASTKVHHNLYKDIRDCDPDLYNNRGDKLSEFAGRVCYQAFKRIRPGGHDAYIEHIKESGHGSVLEHESYTFHLQGISRDCSHEIVRHRAGFGFSQLSMRYVDPFKYDLGIVLPPDEVDSSPWHVVAINAMLAYENAIERAQKRWPSEIKKQRQYARRSLPGSIETRMVVTANIRAWRHFIEMRLHESADDEIRRLAFNILAVLQKHAPTMFGDYPPAVGAWSDYQLAIKYKKV